MTDRVELKLQRGFTPIQNADMESMAVTSTEKKTENLSVFEAQADKKVETKVEEKFDNKDIDPKLAEYGIDLNKPFEITPEMIKKMKSKGKKGFLESLKDGVKNAIPFASGALEIKNSVELIAIARKQERGEKLTKEETEKMYLYLLEQVEAQHRGSSFWGKVGEGLTHMPAFAGEFFLTGGVYSLGKTAATKAATKIAGEITKKQLAKYITKNVAEVAVGAAARSLVLSNTYANIAKRRLEIDTAKLKDGTGELSLKESKESLGESIGKGMLDGYIESVSEQSGAGFNYVLSKPLAKLPLGKFLVPSGKTKEFMTKTGFNGILEEFAEERFGGFLRGATKLENDESKSYLENVYDSTVPTWEQAGVEVMTTTLWGGGMSATHRGINKFVERKYQEAMADIEDMAQLPEDTSANKPLKEKVKDGIATVINKGTDLVTKAAPFIQVYGEQLPAMPLALSQLATTESVGALAATAMVAQTTEVKQTKQQKSADYAGKTVDEMIEIFEKKHFNLPAYYHNLKPFFSSFHPHFLELNFSLIDKVLELCPTELSNEEFMHLFQLREGISFDSINFSIEMINVISLKKKDVSLETLISLANSLKNNDEIAKMQFDWADEKLAENLDADKLNAVLSNIRDDYEIAKMQFDWADEIIKEYNNISPKSLKNILDIIPNKDIAIKEIEWCKERLKTTNYNIDTLSNIIASISDYNMMSSMVASVLQNAFHFNINTLHVFLDIAEKAVANGYKIDTIAKAIANFDSNLNIAKIQANNIILHWAELFNGNREFTMWEIAQLAKLDQEQFLRAKNELFFLEKREFNGHEIAELAKLNDEQFEKAKKELFFLEKREFNGHEIAELAKLNDEQFEKAKKELFFLEKREFNGHEIAELAKLNDEQFEKAKKELFFLEKREFNGHEIAELAKLNDEQFEKAKKMFYIPEIKEQLTGEQILTLFFTNEKYLSDKSFKEKSSLLHSINGIFAKVDNEGIKKVLNLEKIKNTILKSMQNATESIEVSLASKKLFFHNTIGITKEDTVDTIKNLGPLLEKYGKKGLPLEYSRENFVQDLINVLGKLPQDQQSKILQKIDVKLTADKTGYDGLLQFSKLDDNNPIENEIKKLVQRFLLNNKIHTGDEKVDNILNSLIQGLPEFINIIGKKHHGTHQYTIDVHTIKVLQEALSHPKFNELSNLDKLVLQLSIIFHDLGKSEGVVDTGHEFLSALYTTDILRKFNLPISIKDRISEMVKFHDWFAQINTNKATPEDVAVMFRNPEDLTLAEIFAKSDLMGVSKIFHDNHIANLNEKVRLAREALSKLYQGGNMLFTTRVLNSSLIPRQTLNGIEYKVIDFTKISEDFDLKQYGLSVSKKSDFRILNHCGDFEVMKALTNPAHEAFICTTLISPNKKATYAQKKVGMLLEVDNINIINSYWANQGSGNERNFNNFVNFVLGKKTKYRDTQSKIFMIKINLSKEEYGLLYKELLNKKYFEQIQDVTINGKTITKEQIIEAYKAVEDEIMKNTDIEHNEINVYNPKIKGVIFIGDSLSDVPADALNFAKENDLPIFLMGKR